MYFGYLVNYDDLSNILPIIVTYISLAFLLWDIRKQPNPDKAYDNGLTARVMFTSMS